MIFLYISFIIFTIILTNENNNKGSFIDNKIFELNDTSIDDIIQEGKIYRWLILFYSNLNNNCTKAKKEMETIFNSFHDIPELRFAQMDINENIMTKIRLNINKIPCIILLENGTYYEMKLNLTHENLEDYIFTIFSEVKSDLKIWPKKVKYIQALYAIYGKKFENLIHEFNQVLAKYGIKIHFNIKGFIFTIIFVIIIIYFSIKLLLYYCFDNSEEIAIELKKLEEEFNKRKKEIEKEEKNVSKMNDLNYTNGINGINNYKFMEEEEEEETDEDYFDNDDEEEGEEEDDDDEIKKLNEERKKIEEEIKKIKEEKKKKKKEKNHKSNNDKDKNE